MRALTSCLHKFSPFHQLGPVPFRLSRTGSTFSPRHIPSQSHRRFSGYSRVFATVVAPPIEQGVTEMAPTSTPKTIYRKDYTPTPYLIPDLSLDFQLNEDVSKVKSKLSVIPNYKEGSPSLVLDGREDVSLQSVKINGQELSKDAYERTEQELTILKPPSGSFELEIEVDIKPQENTILEGLYKSSGNYCTQCEAEGFRGITYFLDRPDVLAKYTVRIEAEKSKYPVLLSNGNLLDSGDSANGRHFTLWEDPNPKPSYLFALVAGDLASLEGSFKTKSGRDVKLRMFADKKDIDKTKFALDSLVQAMKWDEKVFGLEYHLNKFDVVAMHDFNSGAMENTSLNIFNSRLILASPDTATDSDYSLVEGVIGHEYFHNWTGNRVTCRDWFQLTLKEGLTVFRDQEFSSDMNSRAVKRISDVSRLRQQQFPEDAGGMAHPIRPNSYVRMDNFYSATVYEKGAEVIRLYHTLLGSQGFRKGMDLYFKRHDGQAVTCDDFRSAMADANNYDLSGLEQWYAQAGTPQVTLSTSYDQSAQTFTIQAEQKTSPTPGQEQKSPVLIPLKIALFNSSGQHIPLRLKDNTSDLGDETVLELKDATQSFTFTSVPEKPVLSALRGFSAPVSLKVEGETEEDLIFLLAHDTDSFNKWEASQRLQKDLIGKLYLAGLEAQEDDKLDEQFASAGGVPNSLLKAFTSVLEDESSDPALIAAAISAPATSELVNNTPNANPVILHKARSYVGKQLAKQLRPQLQAVVKRLDSALNGEYTPDAESSAKRTLKNKALQILAATGEKEILENILKRSREATNMTDQAAAVSALIDAPGPERDAALEEFYEKWQNDNLVVLKWLALKAASNIPNNVETTRQLKSHKAFNIKNPNSCYSLFRGFCQSIPNFHAEDGSGYKFLADSVIEIDKINRSVAARVSGVFTRWRQLDEKRQKLMQAEIKRILAVEGISENLYEVMNRSL